MDIKWGALGQVFLIGVGASVAVVVVFALGILALSQSESAQEQGESGTVGLAGAALCFTACAAMVVYGIYLIVPQFHH
jgi:hypothetical protein